MSHIIETKEFGKQDVNEFIKKRMKLIDEAIAFPIGTHLIQTKTIVNVLPDGTEAYFLKPGKEARRKTPNLNDMFPVVGKNTDNWAFEQLWEYLIKVSIIQQDAFKQILTLLYRLCYFTDHNANLRYEPSESLKTHISNIEEYILNPGFKEKFNTNEVFLLEFINFVELLAWNEDVKYNAGGISNANKDKGRVNTIMSIIGAPILISKFIDNILQSTNGGVINVKLITSTIQKFTRTRGLCTISKKQLLSELTPYLIK